MDTPWQTLIVATLLLQVFLALGALPSGESSDIVGPWDTYRNLPLRTIPPPPAPPTMKCGLPEDELDLLVKKFNAHRLEVAEKDQIPNMHEMFKRFKRLKVIKDDLFYDDLKFGDAIKQNYPLITGFAFCVYRSGSSQPYKSFIYSPTPLNNTNHVAPVPPGSQCPNGKAASGLCNAPWNTETTTLPPVPPTTQPAEEIDNGAKLAYSFCLILLALALLV